MMARKCASQITGRCGSAATSSCCCPQKPVIERHWWSDSRIRIKTGVWFFEVRNFVPALPRFATCAMAGGSGSWRWKIGGVWCCEFEVPMLANFEIEALVPLSI
jgi:hypothetical protein